MTLVLKCDLYTIKMYEVPIFNSSKVIIWTDTQTDRWTDRLDWNYYLSAYADGKNTIMWLLGISDEMNACTWNFFTTPYHPRLEFRLITLKGQSRALVCGIIDPDLITNACSKVHGRDQLGCHAGCQEVGRCRTRH